MKIAYIVTRSDAIGGVQVHVRDLAAAVRAQGYSASVIIGGDGPLVGQLQAQGTPTTVLQHLTMPISPVRDLQAIREIRRVLAELRPDLLSAHSSKARILGLVAGRSLRIPVVFTAHGWSFTPGIPLAQAAVYRQIERLAGPFASKIITVSEFDRRLALDAGITREDRLVTVHNGMPDIPPASKAQPGLSPARLVMVARFEPQKDHHSLLHALAGLQHRAWDLDLVGDGPLRARTESLAAALGLGARVHFLGQRADVEQILARAQIALLVTNWEGFPRSILEAMRAGLPVVASAVGGIEESVRDQESGYLVPRGDVDLLRDRLGRLLADPELRTRLGNSGRVHYEKHFTLAQTVAKTLAVYKEVLTAGWAGPVGHHPLIEASPPSQ